MALPGSFLNLKYVMQTIFMDPVHMTSTIFGFLEVEVTKCGEQELNL